MQNTVIVITGASGGIGSATAELLVGRGASVILVGRRLDALTSLADRLGQRALPVAADVTVREDVARVVAQTLERVGHIDVWINNAGQGIFVPPSQLTDDDVDEMVRVNVKSALYGMQAVLPHFKSRGEHGTGHIINVSSILGRIPYVVNRSAYNGAKHFLNSLTANFREEVQTSHPGIQFSVVSPGVVRTLFGLNARGGGPDSRTLPFSQSAEDVAAVIATVIETRQPDAYTIPGTHERVVEYYRNLISGTTGSTGTTGSR